MALITSAIGVSPEAIGAGGARVHAEDVMDMVFDKSAHLTAGISSLPRIGVKAKTIEWIIDKMEVVGDPTLIARAETQPEWERGDVTFTKRSRLFTQVQNFRADLEVHDFNDAVLDAFGVADEYSYQGKKKMKLLGIAAEKAMWKDTIASTSNAGHIGTDPAVLADPTRMKPLTQQLQHKILEFGHTLNYLDANDMSVPTLTPAGGNDAGTAVIDAGDLPAANVRINEDIINKAAELGMGYADQALVQYDTVLMATAPFGHIGNFGSVASPATATAGHGYGALRIQKDMNLQRVARAVKVYGTQYGDMAFIFTRWLQQAKNVGVATTYNRGTTPIDHRLYTGTLAAAGNFGNVWLWDSSMVALAVARPLAHKPLSKQGDSTIGMVVGDLAVVLKHPAAAMCVHAINSV